MWLNLYPKFLEQTMTYISQFHVIIGFCCFIKSSASSFPFLFYEHEKLRCSS